MSVLSESLASCAKQRPVHLDSLDLDVDVRKITIADSKKLEAFGKKHKDDPAALIVYMLHLLFSVDGEPVCAADEVETGLQLSSDVVEEVNRVVAETNNQNFDELKKKAVNSKE